MYNTYNPYVNNMMPPMNAPVRNYNQPNQLIGAWVQGVEGAKGFQMAPNTVAVLLDSDQEGMMYIKNTDNIGMANLECYEFHKVKSQPANSLNLDDYVRKDELSDLIAKIAGGSKDESAV